MAVIRGVQHWIASLNCEVEGPAGPQNHYRLFGVGYTHVAPPETEFPWALDRLDLFARFVGGTGIGVFEVGLDWLDAWDRPRLVDTYGPFQVAFRPGEPTRDHVFRLVKVLFPAVGRSRVRLSLIRRRKLSVLRTEFLEVRHQP